MATGKDLNPSYLRERGRHSDGQRFRFHNFAQRVAAVDIDVHHRLTADDMAEWRREAGEEEAEEARPFAMQTLERWVELNQTGQFTAFRTELSPMLLSVPLMLHRQDAIFEALHRHLTGVSTEALPPMLELATALAVDLRQEFYPRFAPLLGALGRLLGSSAEDVARVEAVFTAAAYLLKYLLRQLLADLPAALAAYAPLLSHPKQHVRDFAAESFSYLLRRLPRASLPAALPATLLPQIGCSSNLDSGIALLLFHTVRGLSQRFHSRTPEVLAPLLEALSSASASASASAASASASAASAVAAPGEEGAAPGPSAAPSGGSRGALLEVLSEALGLMSEHTRRQHCGPVWSALLCSLDEAVGALCDALQPDGAAAEPAEPPRGRAAGPLAAQVASLCRLAREWVAARRGSRVPPGDLGALLGAVSPLLGELVLPCTRALKPATRRALLEEVSELIAAALLVDTPATDAAVAAASVMAASEEPGAGVLRQAEVLLHALFGDALSSGGAGADDDAAELLPLRLGLQLAGWRRFGEAVLPLLLARCDALAPRAPWAVRALLLGLSRAQPPPPPVQLPAECAALLIDALEAPARPSAPVSTGREAWEAASALACCAPLPTAVAERCRVALRSLLATPHPAARAAGPAGRPHEMAAVAAAALNALVASTPSPSVSASKKARRRSAAAADAADAAADEGPRQLLRLGVAALRAHLNQAQPSREAEGGAGGGAGFAAAAGPSVALLQACAAAARTLSAAGGGGVGGGAAALSEPLSALWDALLPSLSHGGAAVRGAALDLLSELERLGVAAADGAAAAAAEKGSTARMLELCLALEASPQAPTSRQLVLDAEALTRLATSGGAMPPHATRALAYYSLGVLRIRFARAWAHGPPLLQAIARSQPTTLWPLVVDAVASARRSLGIGGGGEQGGGGAVGGGADAPEDAAAEEGSVPEGVAALWAEVQSAWAEVTSPPAVETEVSHLATQLLKTLAASGPLHGLAVRHAGDLMPHWHELARDQLRLAAVDVPADSDAIPDADADAEADAEAAASSTSRRAASGGKKLLAEWLRFFAAVEAPRRLPSADALYGEASALVGHPLPAVQTLALDVLARWGQPPLLKYRKQLGGLVDGKTFRETLALFDVDAQGSTLAADERSLLLPLLCRLLFARLTRRVGRGSSKSGMASTRATVFAFFGGFAPAELRPLLDLMLAPIAAAAPATLTPLAAAAPSPRLEAAGGGGEAAALWRVDGSVQLGVLRSLHEAAAQLGVRLLPYAAELLAADVALLQYSSHCAAAADPAEAELMPAGAALPAATTHAELPLPVARDVRGWAIKLLGKLCTLAPPEQVALEAHTLLLEAALPRAFACVAPVMLRLHTHYTQSPAGLLSLLLQLAQSPHALRLLRLSPAPPLDCAFRLLSAPAVAPAVVDVVLSLAETLLAHTAAGKGAGEAAVVPGALGGAVSSLGGGEGAHAIAAPGGAASAAVVAAAAAEARSLLETHVALLLSQLHARLQRKFGGDPSKALAAAGTGDQATRELRLLSALVGYVASSEQAEQLVQLFLPYLRLKSSGRAERVKEHVLRVLRGLLRLVPQPHAHTRFLGLLFGALRSRGAREALCGVWATLAELEDGSDAPAPAPFPPAEATRPRRGGKTAADKAAEPAAAPRPSLRGIRPTALALQQLNAYAPGAIDEPDYDARIDAYSSIPPLLESGLSTACALPLLCQCVHDVELDDIALRHSATHTVGIIVQHAAAAAGRERAAAGEDGGGTGQSHWHALLQQVLMPALRRGLRLPPEKELVRAEMIRLISVALSHEPSLEPQLAALLSPGDLEADFFQNITHVQLPRRQRAIARLKKKIEGGAFGSTTLASYLLPLLSHIALKPSAKEVDVAEEAVAALRSLAAQLPWRPYHELLLSLSRRLRLDPSLERRLVRALVAVIDGFHFDLAPADDEYGAPSADRGACRLTDEEIGRIFAARVQARQARDYEAADRLREELVAKGIVSVDDKGNSWQAADGRRGSMDPFSVDEASRETGRLAAAAAVGPAADGAPADSANGGEGAEGGAAAAVEAAAEEEDGEEVGEDELLVGAAEGGGAADADAAPSADDEAVRARARAILQVVQGKLLPQLYTHIKDPKTEGARVSVALAVLKLLKLMPPRVLKLQLRGFLMRLVATLSSREKSVRQKGREALAMVAVELGAEHFGAIAYELQSSLRRGFQLQVLGHALHFLLAKLVPTVAVGSLDSCAPLLVRLILADVFGEAAEKKEVDAIANSMREAHSTMSFASMELLASVITFVPTVNELVPHIHRAAVDAGGATTLKHANNARELLRRCVIGLSANPSVGLQPLTVYCAGLLSTHLPPKRGGAAPAPAPTPADAAVPAGGDAAPRRSRAAPVDSVLRPEVEEGVTSGSGGGGPLAHELLGFSLSLLLSALRRGRFESREPEALALLEPFLPLLVRAMRSDDDAVVSTALRVLSSMLGLPLRALPAHAMVLLDRTMGLLRKSANFTPLSDLVGVCLKVVTALLRKPPRAAAAAAPAAGDAEAAAPAAP